jgi:hypothetical protein
MWNWFNCYLSGRHEYGVWCEPGTIFLRCVHCGRRSSGWALGATSQPSAAAPAQPATVPRAPAASARVVPFQANGDRLRSRVG